MSATALAPYATRYGLTFAMDDQLYKQYVETLTEGPPPTVEPEELVKLCAVDTELFGKTFFPRTLRQDSPSFAPKVWDVLDGNDRCVNLCMFRGSAKTTRTRIYMAKRIAYNVSRTILITGKSESHAVRTLQWMKKQVEFNQRFCGTFGLHRRNGGKWTDVECEIWHGIDDQPIWIIAMGMGGAIRGINRDDYRPDLILMDDIHDEENSATLDQRKKIDDLVYGALMQSLAPRTEVPSAKIINLFTPLNKEDTGTRALQDREWKSLCVPCWTPETAELPPQLQQSCWEERYPTEELRQSKELAAARNKLPTWLREYELKLVAAETASFRSEWLKRYSVLPDGMVTFLAIDPVPPPSTNAVAKGLHRNDWEVLLVIGIWRGAYFILDITAKRGHDPSWTQAEFFRLALKWRPRRIFVDAIAYQRTLSWLLKQEMQRRAIYFAIEEVTDQRSKHDKIVDGINGVASNGMLHIPADAEMRDEDGWKMFFEQFAAHPHLSHDDVIDALAMAITGASGRFDMSDGEGGAMTLEDERREFPRLAYSRGSP